MKHTELAKLAFKHYPKAGRTTTEAINLVLLHGYMGKGRNFANFAQKISTLCNTFALDLRNHGDSEHMEEMTLDAMSFDVANWADQMKIKEANKGAPQNYILGHSIGGKVAMDFAIRNPEITRGVIIVDIAPKIYDSKNTTFQMIDKLLKQDIEGKNKVGLNETIKYEKLKEKIIEIGMIGKSKQIGEFFCTNLKRDKEAGHFKWICNLPILVKNYHEMCKWPPDQFENIGLLRKDQLYHGPVKVILGKNSDYVTKGKFDEFSTVFKYFDAERDVKVLDTGHWVHAEKPVEFHETVRNFITETEAGYADGSIKHQIDILYEESEKKGTEWP